MGKQLGSLIEGLPEAFGSAYISAIDIFIFEGSEAPENSTPGGGWSPSPQKNTRPIPEPPGPSYLRFGRVGVAHTRITPTNRIDPAQSHSTTASPCQPVTTWPPPTKWWGWRRVSHQNGSPCRWRHHRQGARRAGVGPRLPPCPTKDQNFHLKQ